MQQQRIGADRRASIGGMQSSVRWPSVTQLPQRSIRRPATQLSNAACDVHSTLQFASAQDSDCQRPGPCSQPGRPQALGIAKNWHMAMNKGVQSLRRLSLAMNALIRQQQQQQMLQGLGRVMAMGLVAPTLPGSPTQDLLSNHVLMTGFWAWFFAQFAKIFTNRFKKGVWDIRALWQPGGMPSSHSSLCTGVTTAVALQYGLVSPLFAVTLAFSVIVMYDAMGVRQHAGKQAEVLNQVIDELMTDHPVVAKIKLKEVLGHTPRQVACGALLGMVVALLYPCVRA